MRSPLLGVATCWALGILLANNLHAGAGAAEWLLAAVGGALGGSLIAHRRKSPGPAVVMAAAGFLLAGAASAALFPARFPPKDIRNLRSWGFDTSHPIITKVTVESVPVRSPSGFEFNAGVLEIGGKENPRPASGKVLLHLRVPAKAAAWAAVETLRLRAGEIIQAPVRFYHPKAYRNPGSFDYGEWLESIEDVSWEGTIENPVAVLKVAGRGISWESAAIARVRGQLLDGIDRLYPPWSAEGRDGAVLKAVLLGDRSALDSTTIEGFRKSGLYHLLVISGLHVGLLAALALGLFRWLGLREAWRGGALILMLAGYALLVEQRAPTLRATLMIALYLLARYLYRDRAGLNAVGFAALILLAVRPPWLFEAGFQLSFSAALLIFAVVVPILEQTTIPYARALNSIEDEDRDVSLAPRQAQFRIDLRAVIEFLKRRNRMLGRYPAFSRGAVILPLKAAMWLADLAVFSAILQTGLMMPMAESFHRVTFAGIGLNTLAFPLMAVLLGLAVPTVILSATVPVVAAIPGKLLAGVISILFWLTSAPHLPWWLSYRVPAPPAWVAWGFALSLVAVAWTLAQRKRTALVAAASMFATFATLLAWHPFPARIPSGELQATALDCGRGRASFIVLPDRTTVLVGTCGAERTWWDAAAYQGRWDPGEDIVSPYLWSRGIKHIDALVVPDLRPGMLDGMPAVIRNFRPHELWEARATAGAGMDALVRLMRAEDGHRLEMDPGRPIREHESVFLLLAAPADPSKGENAGREPFGLRISSAGGSLILLDLPQGRSQAELPLLPSLRSEVMETPGRGAATFEDTALLERILPKIVVVSGGQWKQDELQISTASAVPPGTTVLSTERDGAITVDLKNSRLAYYADVGSAKVARAPSGSKAF